MQSAQYLQPSNLKAIAPTETRASLQSVVDEVRREYPGDTLSRLRMPQRRDGTYELWLGASPSRYVYADPYSGTLLGTRRPTEFLTGWLFLLHSQLLGGEVGRRVVGTGALCLVLLSMTGLVAWWPRRAPWRAWAQWRAALTVVRNHGATRTLYDLHRAIGSPAAHLGGEAVGVSGTGLQYAAPELSGHHRRERRDAAATCHTVWPGGAACRARSSPRRCRARGR